MKKISLVSIFGLNTILQITALSVVAVASRSNLFWLGLPITALSYIGIWLFQLRGQWAGISIPQGILLSLAFGASAVIVYSVMAFYIFSGLLKDIEVFSKEHFITSSFILVIVLTLHLALFFLGKMLMKVK